METQWGIDPTFTDTGVDRKRGTRLTKIYFVLYISYQKEATKINQELEDRRFMNKATNLQTKAFSIEPPLMSPILRICSTCKEVNYTVIYANVICSKYVICIVDKY